MQYSAMSREHGELIMARSSLAAAAALIGIATAIALTGPSAQHEAAARPMTLAGGATIGYESFAARASGFDGVAIVRVGAVGAPAWNTPDGTRPSDHALIDAMSEGTQFDYFIGTPVSLELVRMIRGDWNAPTSTTTWWRAGGGAQEDRVVIDDLRPPAPSVGQLAVAFTFDTPREPTPGVSLFIAEAYPVQADGRVLTPLPTEVVLLADLPGILAPGS